MNKARKLLLAISVVAVFAFLIRADLEARRTDNTAPTALPVVGAGYWIADTGDVIELRNDGTGCSRHFFRGTVQRCEFDWSCDGDMLTVENFPNVLGSFMEQFTGLPTAQFPVVSLTDRAFVFRHNGNVTLTAGTGREEPTVPRKEMANHPMQPSP